MISYFAATSSLVRFVRTCLPIPNDCLLKTNIVLLGAVVQRGLLPTVISQLLMGGFTPFLERKNTNNIKDSFESSVCLWMLGIFSKIMLLYNYNEWVGGGEDLLLPTSVCHLLLTSALSMST